jgi:hypothetical protein
MLKDAIPKIITPSKKKYQETYCRPYRALIRESDNLIQNANSFLVVGFGFNDEHLTPEIRKKVNNGTPIVLITRNVSESSLSELINAEKYMLFEQAKNNKTKVSYKKNSRSKKEEVELNGNFWELDKFMEIL